MGHSTHADPAGRDIRCAVITVSDRSAAGLRADGGGPLAVRLLGDAGFAAADAVIVPDGAEPVRAAIEAAVAAGARVVVTTGGTGVGPRDATPEGTRPLIDRDLPGIADAIRRAGADRTPAAVLSRGLAGVVDARGDRRAALVVNLAGSPRAVEEGIAVLVPLLPHLVGQLDGGDHA